METTNTSQTVEVEKEVQGKLVWSFEKPTPKWATTAFRAVFLLTLAISAIIVFEPGIADRTKVRLLFYMDLIDFVIWGLGRGIGIDKSQFQKEQEGNIIKPR